MEFRVLGELRVFDGAAERTPRGQRSRDLLAVLLQRRGQPVDPRTLLDEVWGTAAQGLEVSVVHTQVARVRRALGNAAVERSDAGYRLVDACIDADEFVDSVRRARQMRSADQALALVERALARWRSDSPYADVTSTLVEADVARLREVRSDARELQASVLLDRGEAHQALEVAVALVAENPMRERGHELLMMAQWRLARQSDALASYDRLRHALRDELGVDPGASARGLHARMLAQDPSLMAPASPAAALDGSRTAPPAPATRLVDREQERDTLLRLVGERRLITLVGPGGVGKSRLLADLHQQLAGIRPTAYVDLSPAPDSDSDRFTETVLEALGLSLGTDDPSGSLVAALAETDLVLLVDEAERNLAATAALCSQIAAGCPEVTIVVASRRSLDLVGEAIIDVPPLACPARGADPRAVAASPAVQLLAERIADHAPLADLGPRAELLAEIARRVDGLPLALELVAGHVRTRPISELAGVLADPVNLTAVEVDRPERHRSLGHVVRWSVERIPAAQAAALRRLGVFAGSFSMQAGVAVIGTDDAEDLIRALVRECLVHMERAGGVLLLRLLAPIRDLALAEIGAVELVEACRRHRHWHAERWRGAQRSDDLIVCVRHHYDDYLAALESALEARDDGAVADLVMTVGWLWIYTERSRTGMAWSDRVLASGLLDPVPAARLRALRCSWLFHQSPDRVVPEVEAVAAVLTEARDAAYLAIAHLSACAERHESGDLVASMTHGDLAVAASREASEELQADALSAFACTAAVAAPDVGEAAAREAWALVRRSGSLTAINAVATNVSWALLGLGRPEDARDVLTLTLDEGRRLPAEVAEALGPDSLPAFLRLNLAWCELLCGEPAAAVRSFAKVLEASPDAVEDRKGADVFVGAAAALAELDDPAAPELLAGAATLVERTALTLMPWQEKLLAQAIERAGGRDLWSWSEDLVSGQRLADLLAGASGSAVMTGR
ncbi:MAG TPA: BTAD domain-containing putative transcriptional regulator [Marmoricola sp.]|jgi:predicted ATPase/DNA-binding SARP family transcriptional activator|nr:BTAD domain-containing putative transcriptional regulator [Marmoricola sp.]